MPGDYATYNFVRGLVLYKHSTNTKDFHDSNYRYTSSFSS